MLNRARNVLVVTLFALVLWIFAESESLGEYSSLASVRFTPGDSAARLIAPDPSFDGTVTIDLVGSKAAISRSEAALAGGIRLEPGMPGIPASDGRHTVSLIRAIQDYAPLKRTGVRIASVTPQAVEVQVTELVTIEAPIDPALEGVEVVGEVRLVPDRASIRIPKSAAGAQPESLRLRARLDERQLSRLPAGGPVKEEAALLPPPALASLPGFSMDRATATIEFTIRSRSDTEKLASVPVQVVLPPVEVGRWIVEIETEDRFLAAEASGPREAIDRIKSGTEAVIAIVALSSDELQARIPAKDATFAILRNGVITARPELAVTTAKSAVRLRIAPKDTPGAAP